MNYKLESAKPNLNKNSKPSLHEWLIGLVLLISLLMLIVRLSLQSAASHYQQANQQLQTRVQKLQQELQNQTVSPAVKQRQQRILALLQLTTENLDSDLFLTELAINENSLVLQGRAANTAQVKHYAEAFSPKLSLEDFAFENDSAGGIQFKLRFSYP